MSALNFIDNLPKRITPSFPKVEEKIDLSWSLNCQLMTFITSDIMAGLTHLSDEKVLKLRPFHKFFQKESDKDMDSLTKVYHNFNRSADIKIDYAATSEFFINLSRKLTSPFQRNNDPYLLDLLTIILSFEYIYIATPNIAIRDKGKPKKGIMESIELELKILRSIFDERFKNVSNFKFTHNQYEDLFKRILRMDHHEFSNLIQTLK